jgi:hypothetical protein
LPVPTRCGNRHDTPSSAVSPRRAKTDTNDASAEAKRRSHIAASRKPPPAVTPLIAAMIGFGCSSK